jgi:hypothetical protein
MKFRTFSLKGEDKLQEFLADLGIPLSQVESVLSYSLSDPESIRFWIRYSKTNSERIYGPQAVLRIRDIYPRSRIQFFPFRISDPNFFHPGAQICLKEFEYFKPKNGF